MNLYDPDTEHETAEQPAPNDRPAFPVVLEILEALEYLATYCGMAYDLDLSFGIMPNGKRLLSCNVWAQVSEKNTHLAPDNDGWRDDLLQPIVSSVHRTIDGESVKNYGSVVYDDNSQDGLHRLLGLLWILRGEHAKPCNDDDLPF